MPKTGKGGGTTQLTDQTEDAKSMQKGRRLHHQHQRSSPPPRAPRVSSPRPRVSPNPAEKEKTEQHRKAQKSQAPKRKGTPRKPAKAHQGKAKPSKKHLKPAPKPKWGGKSETEARKTWLLNRRGQRRDHPP